jgi:hypothetical protein
VPSINSLTCKGIGKYCKEVLEGMRGQIHVDLVRKKTAEQDKVRSTSSEIPLRLIYQRLSENHDTVHPDMGIYSLIIYQNSGP